MESLDILWGQPVVNGQLRALVDLQRHLRNVLKPKSLTLEASQVRKGLCKGFHCVESHIVGLLVGLADSDTVVGSVALHELGAARCVIQLFLEFAALLETVKLDRHWELLVGVEFLTKDLWKHFVDTEVSQEAIVLLEQRASVLVLFVIALKLVVANDLRNRGDIKAGNLVFECSLRVLYKHTDAAILLRSEEGVRQLHQLGTVGWLDWQAGHRKGQCDVVVLIVKKSLILCIQLLLEILERFRGLRNLLYVKRSNNLSVDVLHLLSEQLGIGFLLLDGEGFFDWLRCGSGGSGLSDCWLLLKFLAHLGLTR